MCQLNRKDLSDQTATVQCRVRRVRQASMRRTRLRRPIGRKKSSALFQPSPIELARARSGEPAGVQFENNCRHRAARNSHSGAVQ
jgi:hypothetical protein